MKKIASALLAVLVIAASADVAEDAKFKPTIIGAVEFAPFGDVTKKVVALGTMINNPIVPSLLVSSLQQSIVSKFGRFRADSPIFSLVYVDAAALEASVKKGDVDVDDVFKSVLVYPSTMGPAKTLLDHPGSEKLADGTIKLLPSEGHPDPRFVKFTDDGKYSALADSPAIAAQALADFVVIRASRKADPAASVPLVRADVFERGVAAVGSLVDLVSRDAIKTADGKGKNALRLDADLQAKLKVLQENQRRRRNKVLSGISTVKFTLDLDDYGISANLAVGMKPGSVLLQGRPLPKGALDAVPAGSPIFGSAALRAILESANEAEFREDMHVSAELLKGFAASAAKEKDAAPYADLILEAAAAVAELMDGTPYPGDGDYTTSALAFDAAKRPALVQRGATAHGAQYVKIYRRFLDRIASALSRKWPAARILERKNDTFSIDLAALSDVALAESLSGEKDAKKVAKAKKQTAEALDSIAKVLGSKVVENSVAPVEGGLASTFAASGVKAPSAKGDAEAFAAATLPDLGNARPDAVFACRLYSMVRDYVLPIMAANTDAENAKQYQAIIAGMPESGANGGIVGALWRKADGSVNGVFRITAAEVKNYGAAFNAFTAASLAAGMSDDDDDDDDDK